VARHPVDQVPSAPKLAILSVQHVLAFYAGAVIVPLLIAQGLGLSTATTIHLVNADLLTCGIAPRRPQSTLGTAVILSTAAFDAGAAVAQWRLRS